MSFHVLLQVVGLRSGWHTALVMGKFNRRIHATRLAQTRRVVLTASAAGAQDAQTYMQMDGEPWPQMVPGRGKEPLRVGPLFFLPWSACVCDWWYQHVIISLLSSSDVS